MEKLNKELFIEKAKKKYGNKYDYSDVEYQCSNIKIKIICPKHGAFYKTPYNHLLGQECHYCKLEKKQECFIKKCKKIHDDKYDYSKVEYKNSKTKVCIICPEHGEFWQTPYLHLHESGCPKCCGNYHYTTNEWIEKAKIIHNNNKYDYSKVKYIDSKTKVCIVCPEHGEFWQTPNGHLSAKHSCPLCSHPSKKKTIEEFSKQANEIHNFKYNYSKVKYIDSKTKVCIVCPEHGEFWQTPYKHLFGQGCGKCAKNCKITNDDFIEKSNYIHNNFYDYSYVKFINLETKVRIICPEHGEFWQTPHSHIGGHGCPICPKFKNMNETKLFEYIDSNISENVVREKRFWWLGSKSLDIFIPLYNIAIEYQGKQHFEPVDYFGGVKEYENTTQRDEIKFNLCKKYGVKLFYFSKEKNIPYIYFDTIYTNEKELLNEIKSIITYK